MILVIKTECGEITSKNIKDINQDGILKYKDACLFSTTTNAKGEYVKIVNIDFLVTNIYE